MARREEPASPEEAANRLEEIRKRWAIQPWHRGMYGDICYSDADGDDDVVASVYNSNVGRAIAAAPEDVAYLLAEVERLTATGGPPGVAVTVARLEAECREQAERLRVAYDELDEARGNWNAALTARDTWAGRAGRAETALHAVLAALRAGVPLPPEVLDDVTRLAAEAYEQSRADRAELVRQRDEARDRLWKAERTLGSWKAGAEIVERRLEEVERARETLQRTCDSYERRIAAMQAGGQDPECPDLPKQRGLTRADVEARLAGASRPAIADAAADLHYGEGTWNEDACIVNLVCAVLGVPHG